MQHCFERLRARSHERALVVERALPPAGRLYVPALAATPTLSSGDRASVWSTTQ